MELRKLVPAIRWVSVRTKASTGFLDELLHCSRAIAAQK